MSRTRTAFIDPMEEETPGLRVRAVGLALLCAAIFLAISFISYNGSDPSFNRATFESARNWGGTGGAYLSDIALQMIGVANMLIVLFCGIWGWRIVTGHEIGLKALRFSSLMLALLTFATAATFVDAPESWPIVNGLGGAVGALIYDKLVSVINPWVVFIISLAASIAAAPFALGLSLTDCRRIVRTSVRSVMAVMNMLGLLRNSSRRSRVEYAGAQEEKQSWFKKWFGSLDEEEEEELAEEDDEDSDEPASRSISRVEKPRTPRVQQATFELKPGGKYRMPGFDLLAQAPKGKKASVSQQSLDQNARMLESVLQDFGVSGEITKIRPGPVVTLYELEPSPGTKSSRVIGLADDISRSMSATSTRIAVIPGRNAIGIELPNSTRETVYLRELFEHEEFRSTETKLPLALGKDIGGAPIIVDLAKMPHLLVAGTTGSGKSVAINTMIMSLVYHHKPDDCKFIMIDPKMLELSVYDGIPHLLTPVVTEPGKAVVALKWTVKEMENRYRLMSNLGVRNIEGYNRRITEAKQKGEVLQRSVQTGFDPESGEPIIEDVELDMTPLPFIVVVVDEMADLMIVAGKDIETLIQRLAQMARAAGIHIIMATQRPSVDVITGVIKANFPTRISFQVTSRIDSRTILGEPGAEQLLGLGDMLYMAGGGRISRIHGPFISDKEVEHIVAHLKAQGTPNYIDGVTDEPDEMGGLGLDGGDGEDDELYQQALGIVLRDKKASTSYVQRCLKIGYNRAARIIERMEKEGVVSAANHVGKREVLAR